MIRIAKTSEDRPSITFQRGAKEGQDKLIEATNELKAFYISHSEDIKANEKKFEFKSELYADPEIKAQLKKLQYNKCCFCEAKVVHVSHGDVEHFRPKAAYKQLETDDYSYPGYYWLAYDWDNLFFSCQLCNQRHKKNLFPLLDESTRVLDHDGDVWTEAYLFLHPVFDKPEEHIIFVEEIPKPLEDSVRGAATIESLGLARMALNEDRRIQLKNFLVLLDLISLYPDTPELKPHHDAAKNFIKENIFEKMKPESEYSLMFQSLYNSRIKAVLENA